jgi:hypothetical protein
MASKTVVYITILLMWLMMAASIGYGSISNAIDLLSNMKGSQDPRADLLGMFASGSNDNNIYKFNWERLNSWTPNLLVVK